MHSQVLERQRGEGAGLDFHDVVVAEVERFQSEEGPELLHRDPGDPVVCSENIDTIAPINDKNTVYLTSGAHQFHVPSYTNSQVPQLACGVKKCQTITHLQSYNLPPNMKCCQVCFLLMLQVYFKDYKLLSMINVSALHTGSKEPLGLLMCYFVYKVITNKVFKKVTCQLLS